MSLDAPRTGLGAATLDTGTRISAGQARRLACATGIIPMVLDGDSVPTDLGRERRLFTKHQKIALAHRYHGCAATGCDRPPPGPRPTTSTPGTAAAPTSTAASRCAHPITTWPTTPTPGP